MAVSPWPAVAFAPSWTPKSLTEVVRLVATPDGGESAQTVPTLEQLTTAPAWLWSAIERMPATTRHGNGPANGAPFPCDGRVNSGLRLTSRPDGSSRSKNLGVEM